MAKAIEPESPILVVSPAAGEVFRAGLTEKGAKAVRLVHEMGIDGRSRFRLAMAAEPREGDVIVLDQGVTFYMDAETARESRGTVIDYQDTADGGRFLLGRPHGHGGGGCGCGGQGHGGGHGGSHGAASGCACGGNHGGAHGEQGEAQGDHGGNGGCACGHNH